VHVHRQLGLRLPDRLHRAESCVVAGLRRPSESGLRTAGWLATGGARGQRRGRGRPGGLGS
jgi:hypothetical protein